MMFLFGCWLLRLFDCGLLIWLWAVYVWFGSCLFSWWFDAGEWFWWLGVVYCLLVGYGFRWLIVLYYFVIV